VPDRIGPFLDRLAHLSLDDLAMLALPEPDAEERAGLLARAATAAADAGRRAELADAPVHAREVVLAAFSFRGFEPTWFGLNWGRSLGRAADRAHLIAAVEDAAVAEVVADLLEVEDVAALREPFELVASMVGTAPASNPPIVGPAPRRAAILGLWLTGLAAIAALADFRKRGSRRSPD
jgi:hypothetical protein